MVSLDGWCRALREQHEFDLQLYQSSHQEWKNRWLHRVLIPVECFSAFLFITVICQSTLPLSYLQLHVVLVLGVGFHMGLVSLVIGKSPWSGLSSFGFMVAAPWISCILIQPRANKKDDKRHKMTVAIVSLGMWFIASSLQVAVGHWLWERNEPDVLSSDQVSWLSLTHSVQIAWTS
ncbi:expressed unknown protein [Seminavis robusta]|uniref:Uncharacterized protein n=1 Tax=Seminavis robusta TaxID=568900 RepID=A0A9N8EQY1_9STRA|nr:expressed unknown protein [Seminavis robusta]|eukprot:Sro1824_g300001.1  (177) ;mRNA; r:10222-10752